MGRGDVGHGSGPRRGRRSRGLPGPLGIDRPAVNAKAVTKMRQGRPMRLWQVGAIAIVVLGTTAVTDRHAGRGTCPTRTTTTSRPSPTPSR